MKFIKKLAMDGQWRNREKKKYATREIHKNSCYKGAKWGWDNEKQNGKNVKFVSSAINQT